jgi:DNA-binding MarR family transcriptional regulator
MSFGQETKKPGSPKGLDPASNNIAARMPIREVAKGKFHIRESSLLDTAVPYDLHILRSLRKIIRAIDLYSHRLSETCGLTVPQLICLSTIANNKRLTAIQLAKFVHISPSTLVGILDRLELKQFIRRERNRADRRQIFISLTSLGQKTVSRAPSPLQDNLAIGLQKLPIRERAAIALSLKNVVDLMEADAIEAAPLLILDRRNYAGPKNRLVGKLRGLR